ncbi:MAG: hypothetical protein ACI9NY_000482 [Kiritimatiellia bacterium]|jgi:hypothetical protein
MVGNLLVGKSEQSRRGEGKGVTAAQSNSYRRYTLVPYADITLIRFNGTISALFVSAYSAEKQQKGTPTR